MSHSIPANPNRHQISFTVAILLSVLPLFLAAWFLGGLESTSFDATDSQGRRLGFNDVLSEEHYGMIWAKGTAQLAKSELKGWSMLLLLQQAIFLGAVLAGQARSKPFTWLLWLQPAFFFWGLVGLYIMPICLLDWLNPFTGNDREAYVDVPFVEIMGQGAWLWACGYMGWKLCWQSKQERQAAGLTRCFNCGNRTTSRIEPAPSSIINK